MNEPVQRPDRFPPAGAANTASGRPSGAFVACLLLVIAIAVVGGCDSNRTGIGRLEEVWELRGVSPGRLQKPRAMAIDGQDRLYIVDMTARIQVFDTRELVDGRGKFLRYWETPEKANGRPTGLSIGRDGQVLVADTHYYRVLIYSPDGDLLRTIGGTRGFGPGEFELVRDVAQDSQGNYYTAEMGENDRIQVFSPDGQFIRQWGSHGTEPGQLIRPESLAIDEKDQIWVADACNHRIQVFAKDGELLTMWGTEGKEPGQLNYPYDLVMGDDDTVYVCEFGNHRVQKFTRDGKSLGCWGKRGRGDGELYNPWALARDSRGRIYVLDTYNHRVQCVTM